MGSVSLPRWACVGGKCCFHCCCRLAVREGPSAFGVKVFAFLGVAPGKDIKPSQFL